MNASCSHDVSLHSNKSSYYLKNIPKYGGSDIKSLWEGPLHHVRKRRFEWSLKVLWQREVKWAGSTSAPMRKSRPWGALGVLRSVPGHQKDGIWTSRTSSPQRQTWDRQLKERISTPKRTVQCKERNGPCHGTHAYACKGYKICFHKREGSCTTTSGARDIHPPYGACGKYGFSSKHGRKQQCEGLPRRERNAS